MGSGVGGVRPGGRYENAFNDKLEKTMVRQEVVQPPTDMKVGPRSTTAFLSDGRIHPVRTRGFSAHGSTTKATQTEGTHTLVLDKVIHNYGGGLDLASGVYTVSVPGFYALTLSAHLESASNVANGSSVSVFKNDLDLVTRGYFGGQTTGSLSIFGELFLNIGDRLEARIKSNGAHMSKFFFSSRLMVATNVPLPLSQILVLLLMVLKRVYVETGVSHFKKPQKNRVRGASSRFPRSGAAPPPSRCAHTRKL
ncbi:unnamed protein product [Notodromas monacha]|uniref:C1q domain-containing protein n=1 Tax=Notodromas monacha TaxID=399045 RepID=A0A7R9BE86_9CRUS|nr:unnamed protein product [Notodromas monacha]CAG0912616.1 unnamed protein product [Notodromas monacha]